MRRSDRSLLAPAVFGLATTCFGLGSMTNMSNDTDEQRYQSYREASDQQPKAGPKPTTPKFESFKYREPCHEPKGRDESDLCAQWRAANAGEDSALWAKWSVCIGALGLVGLFVSLWYTRRAMVAAIDATKDAEAALKIADRNAVAAERQADLANQRARAYVVVSRVSWSEKVTGGKKFCAQVSYTNVGGTPALNVICDQRISRVRDKSQSITINSELENDVPNVEKSPNGSVSVLGKGTENTMKTLTDEEMPTNIEALIETGEVVIFVHGWIEYIDVFRLSHRTDYCYHIDKEAIATGPPSASSAAKN
jgi:hypothetical protein